MAGDLDIVGTAAVDVVPIAPNFHEKLKALVLPAADRVGEEAGRRIGDAISRNIVIAIPDAITNGGRAGRVAATREGGQVGGAFGNAIKRRLEVAFRSLPRADVRLGDTGFNADMDRIRARIQTLSGKTIGLDIDAGAALAEVTAIDAELERLAARNPSVQVRTDTAAARAALADVQRQINDVDNDDVRIRVHVDVANAKRELTQLSILLGAVAVMPIIPVAAAGIGALASAAVAAGAGVGAFALAAVPTIKSVTGVMQLQSAAADEVARSTGNAGAANVKAAQSALQMANAQSALRNAHRQSAQQIAQANRAVADAERGLSDAKRSARDAEESLTQARRDARQELKSLQDQLLDGILDEREAALRVQEAQQELAQVMADPKATELQKQRARLSLDEATRNVDKQKAKQAELKQSVADATKAGVDGNKNVQAAAQRVADANRKVADQSRAVADAQSKVRDAQVQGAEAVASAERGLAAARLSSVDTTVKSASAADKYRQALAKLTPEQRDLYDAIAGPKGLKAAFKDWSTSLSPDVVPILTRFVNGAKNSLPGLSPLVRETADGISELQDAASADLKKPFWQQFKADINGAAKPAVVGLGKAFGNTLKGMAGVVDAFLPHMDSIADRMVKSTGKFARWGTSLKGSPAFERFLDYAATNGPKLAALFGSIAGAALDVGKALSPLSGAVLGGLKFLVDGIAAVAEHAPWAIQGIWLMIAAVKVFNIVLAVTNAVMSANPIGLIVLGVAALTAGIILAYQHVGWFRTAVDTSWAAIRVATDWLWNKALKPFFQGFADVVVWLWDFILKPYIGFMIAYWRFVGDVIVWLWKGIFSPIFGFIGAFIVWWWKNIVSPIFKLVVGQLKILGSAFLVLYDKAVKPSMDDIADHASWLWNNGLKPAFDLIKSGVSLVADAFKHAKEGIKTHWGSVAQIAAKPVNFMIDWVYNRGIKALFDGISKYAGMDPLPKGPKLLDTNPKMFAGGGRTSGGTPGVDSIPILAMADEFIIKRSSARKIGFDKLAYMNATGELPGVQKFADGGVVGALGGAFDWAKDKVSKGFDFAKAAADVISNPSKVWGKLTKPILDKVREVLGGSPMGKTLTKLPEKAISSIKDKIVDAVSFTGGGGGGGSANIGGSIPTGQRRNIIMAAMAAAHVPPPGTVAQWLAGMNTLITRESGWNPNAINLWDSNAAAGHPSQGLTQTIPGTWSAYVPSSLRSAGILDPVGNVAASIRYIVSRYGNITNVQQANANMPPQGYAMGGRVTPMLYDDGGYLPPGLSVIANGTGSPEPVFTSQQFADISAAKESGPTTVQADVRVFVGDREITDIVRTEINTYDTESATALANGRWT
ncbi:transglycosylase SLT domain-containing protein [Streptomyces asoensis]|uniref:transglycosylase SLT domain-containing protein n=1 Tax=Streptomyces asoensis TaxID=249586 RepID=UPI0033E4089D